MEVPMGHVPIPYTEQPALPEWITTRTVPDLLGYWASRQPDAVALIARSADRIQRRITYGELDALTHQVAVGLQRAGLRPGERIVLMLDNRCGFEAVVTQLAAHKAHTVAVPLNSRYTSAEVADAMQRAQAHAIASFAEQSSAVVDAGLPESVIRIVVGDDSGGGGLEWESLIIDSAESLEGGPYREDESADWLFTSGTTSAPKCAMFANSSCVATGFGFASAIDARPDDVLQTPVPFFTSSGSHCALMTMLWSGCTLVLEESASAESNLRRAVDESTTILLAVPAIFSFMLELEDFTADRLPCLRLLDYGGSPMSPTVINRLYERFPDVELRQTYGLTESGPTGLYLTGEYALSKLGAVGGGPMPLIEFDVQDEHGVSVPKGGRGEICYRGPAITAGYFNDPTNTAKTFRSGWLLSGDIVRVDEDGFVYHLDRSKDIIIRGGFNITSVEVENRLLAHPAVAEAAVIGVSHPKLGEDIVGVVVARSDTSASSEDIIAFCREELADFKVPRTVVFVDEMPRNAMGKLLKRGLRDELGRD
jgi:acyl-CoA synthetase (AMP-forming)/AMP-acid ligase II